MQFAGFQIYTNRFMGQQIVPEPPDRLKKRRGPYKQRTLRRWRRKHPPYTRGDGKYYTMGRMIICHPDDFITLQRAMPQMGGV